MRNFINDRVDDFVFDKFPNLWVYIHMVMDIPHDIKYWFKKLFWRYERSKYGYARCDLWNFCDYLDNIVIKGLTDLRDNSHGYPCLENMDEEKWKETLSTIIELFSTPEPEILWIDFETSMKQYKEYKARKMRGRKLLIKYWDNLWD